MDIQSISDFLEKAKIAYEAEDFEVAAQWYDQAGGLYSLQGDALNAAEMANNRSVCLLRQGDLQGAYQAALGTDRIFARSGDIRRQAMAMGNQAAACEALHKTDEALRLYQHSNELLKQIDEPSLRVYVLQSISGIYLKKRQYLQALAAMQAGLEIKTHLSLREKILRKLLQVVFRLLGRT